MWTSTSVATNGPLMIRAYVLVALVDLPRVVERVVRFLSIASERAPNVAGGYWRACL